ncbi:hypothetical protein OIU77_029818 [Salix suchowensis]|uniref:Uncharacterized protein n=1 Tax=Salix suchowensis TaxID=1278906 RepID=A0ABQ9B9U8_9ROSI|nr:hypothetical protein OIU77_029818 [Salix suchowensis]
MKETDKRRSPNTVQSKRSGKTERRDRRPNQTSNIKGVESKALLHAKPDSSGAILVRGVSSRFKSQPHDCQSQQGWGFR